MSIINSNDRIQGRFKKHKSTFDANVLYEAIANVDGTLEYHQYSDVLFSVKFLNAYNYYNNNVVNTNNIYQFNGNSNIILNDYNLPISDNFTFSACVYFKNVIKQQILFSNNNDFQVILNPIGYNNCIVLKFGNNIHYQYNVIKLNSWNKIIFRCNGSCIQSFINHQIKKQPIENFEIANNVFSIGSNYNRNYSSKFLFGNIKQLSLYSIYKNDSFVINY